MFGAVALTGGQLLFRHPYTQAIIVFSLKLSQDGQIDPNPLNFRVTEMSKDNCMDSKNLAICWWPTLLQYEFGDLGKFEAMRPHLEDIVQMMIDQFRFLYCGQEEVMMV